MTASSSQAKRAILSLIVAIPVVALVAVVFSAHRSRQMERALIYARYGELRGVLASGDTNGALRFIAPEDRDRLDAHSLAVLGNAMRALGSNSHVALADGRAAVWPVHTPRLGVLHGGDCMDMVKVDGEWYFTGLVHVD